MQTKASKKERKKKKHFENQSSSPLSLSPNLPQAIITLHFHP
jgi:hypothetical protein